MPVIGLAKQTQPSYKAGYAKSASESANPDLWGPGDQKKTLLALGLKKIGQVVEHEDTPNILGMLKKVEHLVSVEK